MRWILIAMVVLVPCLGGITAASAEDTAYEAGRKAFDRGDFAQAMEHWKPDAVGHDRRAQFGAGRLLLWQGGKEWIETGVALIRMSADAGYIPALEFMAQSKLQGMYMPQDLEGAARYLVDVTRASRAAKREHAIEAANALLVVQSFYKWGISVAKDERRGARLLREAADMGNAEAQYAMGLEAVQRARKSQGDKAAMNAHLAEAHTWFVLCWKQGGGTWTPGDLKTPKRFTPASRPALAIRKKLPKEDFERSRKAVRAWLDKKDAGTLGWAYDPKAQLSVGERKLKEYEEMQRDIGAGMSSMDMEFQMPCIPMASNARRECVQGHVLYRTSPKPTSGSRSEEQWTYVSGSTTRVFRVVFTKSPGGDLRWEILWPK